jgi:hypothetical protein
MMRRRLQNRIKPDRSIYSRGLFAFAVLAFLLLPFCAEAQNGGNGLDEKRNPLYSHLDLTKKKYYACNVASQCAVVNMPCGAKVVVSEIYRENIQGWYDFVGPRYKCAAWLKPQAAKNITCTNHLCRADIVPYKEPVDQTPAGRDPAYCNTPDDCRAVVKSCGEKMAINKKYADILQKQYDGLKRTSHCFHIDGQVVKQVTCTAHKCGVDLEPPVEAPYKLHPVDPLAVKPFGSPQQKMAEPPTLAAPSTREMPAK